MENCTFCDVPCPFVDRKQCPVKELVEKLEVKLSTTSGNENPVAILVIGESPFSNN